MGKHRTMLVVAPVLPGKEERWAELMQDVTQSHRDEFYALLKQGGVERVRAWSVPTPQGTLAVVLHEGPNPEAWMPTAMEASGPVAERFREMIAEVHGMDAGAGPPPPPALVFDIDTER